jgi:hypothetical protein
MSGFRWRVNTFDTLSSKSIRVDFSVRKYQNDKALAKSAAIEFIRKQEGQSIHILEAELRDQQLKVAKLEQENALLRIEINSNRIAENHVARISNEAFMIAADNARLKNKLDKLKCPGAVKKK